MSQIRFKKQYIKTAKGRAVNSSAWLQRHINDQFVVMAKKFGYCSRAAFKLLEINDKYRVIANKNYILDLGAAPGSWLQVLLQKAKVDSKIVAVDLKPINPKIENITEIRGDFTSQETQHSLLSFLEKKKFELILSDMAPNSCGDAAVDHIRIISLAEQVLDFASLYLEQKGDMVIKILQGAYDKDLYRKIEKIFTKVQYFKPKASYNDSSEVYIVALSRKM